MFDADGDTRLIEGGVQSIKILFETAAESVALLSFPGIKSLFVYMVQEYVFLVWTAVNCGLAV